ncbi:hypothetical protein QP976_12015 [Corynebacterium striatum]|nr:MULTISPECIES: hypothetical protein [Corynebacterium]MDK8813686.1 hypothetical protein [Corynebacterium striatum]HAT1549213.1 hypothetical protein [Corynebacterium striatum]
MTTQAIGKAFNLKHVNEALALVESGKARGTVLIDVAGSQAEAAQPQQ